MTTQESLFGREAELRAIGHLVASARGDGGGLLLRGEAGLGKTSLLALAAEAARAADLQVLRTTGVRSETRLPFAGLHHLLRPILADLGALPARQRTALEAAFGLAPAAGDDPFLIALATLTLLTEAASKQPILAEVDDAQWLDRPTGEALAFVARRLGSDSLALLVAIRPGEPSPIDDGGLPELTLQPLADDAARRLLLLREPRFEPAARDRILRGAAGNPLAIVELADAVAGEVDGLDAEVLPISARIERTFLSQTADLSDLTRDLLLVAAVDDSDDVAEIVAATAAVREGPATAADFALAVKARLVEVDDTLRFRHPLIRSAISLQAPASARRRAHAALAAVISDPDRVAWHRAAAATRADESVAGALDAAARRADDRGAIAVAVSALERAARLSPDDQKRGERLLRAADRTYALGRLDVMARVLVDVRPLNVPALEARRQAWISALALSGPTSSREPANIRAAIEGATRVGNDGNADQSLAVLMLAANRAWWVDSDEELMATLADAAIRVAPDPDDLRLLHIVSVAPSLHGRESLDKLRRRWTGDRAIESDDARLLGTIALWCGALDVSADAFTSSIAGLRAQGRLGFLARSLVISGYVNVNLGMLSTVPSAADEGGRLATETAQPFFVAGSHVVMAMAMALRGDVTGADERIAQGEREALRAPNPGVTLLIRQARTVIEMARGQYADAFDELGHAYRPGDPAHHSVMRGWALSDFVDAAVGSGRLDEIRRILPSLEADAARMASQWLDVGLRYARAVVAADGGTSEQAEAAFAAALEADLSRWPLAQARLLLAQGSWLRRQRRVAESRAPLRTARELFDAMGIAHLGERARQELGASGETSRQRRPDAIDELTPQELQIARLAADGLSNREIGERLYLSHRTVGFHLYHVFPKLGITSRSQLHAAIASAGG